MSEFQWIVNPDDMRGTSGGYYPHDVYSASSMRSTSGRTLSAVCACGLLVEGPFTIALLVIGDHVVDNGARLRRGLGEDYLVAVIEREKEKEARAESRRRWEQENRVTLRQRIRERLRPDHEDEW